MEIVVVLLMYVAIGIVGTIITLIPWFISKNRKIKNTLAIFWLCLVMGWTGIGWIAAFIWAFVEKPIENKD
jgi:hypothetical protein